MADNVTLPGAGAAVATDNIGGIDYQRVKACWGADGVANDASDATPMPVALGASVNTIGAVNVNGTIPISSAALTSLAASIQAEDSPFVSGSYGQLMLAVRADSDTTTANDGDYTVMKLDESGRLKVASMPASYTATIGTITANGQKVFVDCIRFSNLMIHCKGTFSTVACIFEGSLDSTDGSDGTWFTVQAIRSSANTIETATGNLSAAPAYAWELSVNALKFFRVRATAWTSGTQTWTMIPGTYATEPIPGAQVSATQPISGSVTVTASTPATPTAYFLNSAATTNLVAIKATAGTIFGGMLTNVSASTRYVKFYNKATAPVVASDIPIAVFVLAAGSSLPINYGAQGYRCALGIGIAITGGVADTDATAVVLGDVKVSLAYI